MDFFRDAERLSYDNLERYEVVFSLIRSIGAAVNSKVLDVGAGGGRISLFLSTLFSDVTACDIVETELMKTRRRESGGTIRFIQARLPKLPFADSEFDLVVFSEVLDHLETQEQLAAIMEIWRVTRKDGYVVLSTPNPRSIYQIFWERIFRGARGNQPVENWVKPQDLIGMFNERFDLLSRCGSFYIPPPSSIFCRLSVIRKISEAVRKAGKIPNLGLYQYYVLQAKKG